MDEKTQKFIDDSNKAHENFYDYSKTIYVDVKTKVIIICPIHGEFTQAPNLHRKGTKCLQCAHMQRRKSQDEFIEECIITHNDFYDYSKTEYEGSSKNIIIICPIHGEFTQKAKKHQSGGGCAKCAIENTIITQEEFLERCEEKHGDTYDYSKAIYTRGCDSIIVICRIHGEFTIQATSHINRGSGCRKCAGTYQYTTEEIIELAKETHGETYDYSKTEYINATTKITIICPEHGEFMQIAYLHVYDGQGCPKCSGLYKTTEDYIEEARAKYGDRFDYSKTVYVDSRTKIIVICNIHGDEILIRPDGHLYYNGGCLKCSNKQHYTNEEYIEKVSEKHNHKFDYSLTEYIDYKTPIIVICPNHGQFETNPSRHLFGTTCPKCANETIASKNRQPNDELIADFIHVHGGLYDYSRVDHVNQKTKIEIICEKHGSFWQLSGMHKKGHGCARCSIERNADRRRLTTEEVVEKFISIHGDRYDYSKVIYLNYNIKVEIICKQHGSFWQQVGCHNEGKGCPKCQLCPSCMLWMTRGKLCEYCKPKTNNKKYVKTKEYDVVNFLKGNLPDNEFIHNRSVGSECTGTNLFPDIRFDCDFYHLIVEVDEHKHRGAGYECDEKRMYDIIAKLGMPCIFIRYNPDSKESDKNALLELIKKYLDINEDNLVWNEFGFAVEYLFYD